MTTGTSGASGTQAPLLMADALAESLFFDSETLRHVIRAIGPCLSRKILLAPSVGDLRVSGVIFRGDIRYWMRSLQRILPVDVEERDRDVLIRFRRANPPNHTVSRTSLR